MTKFNFLEVEMKVYHMSQTLKLGDELQAGYKRNIERCKEFAESFACVYAPASAHTV